MRGRLPPGGAAVGAALGPGSADQQRGERDRHAQRAARGPRQRRRRVVYASSSSVYGATETLPEARGSPRHPDLPLRGRQARRRGLLPQLLAGLRARDRGPALLQRLRAAAGPALPVRRGDPELHHRLPRRPPAEGLRRRRAVARLHLRRRRRAGEPARRRGRGGLRSSLQHRRRNQDHDQRPGRGGALRPRAARSRRSTSRGVPATSGIRSPTSRGPGRSWATSRRPDLSEGLRLTVDALRAPEALDGAASRGRP